MDRDTYLEALRGSVGALLSAAGGALDSPVPSCPGWDMADLVVHMGLVWGWAARIVDSGGRAEREEPPPDRREAPLLEWARERAERVTTSLGAADPDSDCWTFGPPRTRHFWIRRQALETALHAWDAQHARGTAQPLDPELSADGVDELLTVMVPRLLGREPGDWAGQSVHLHRSDGDGEWLARLGPAGTVSVERSHAKADVALRGPAEALWLWCTNRAGAQEVGIEVFGDRAVAERWAREITL